MICDLGEDPLNTEAKFVPKRPCELVVADITCIVYRGGFSYLSFSTGHAPKFPRLTLPQNVARDFFDGGAKNKKFTRRNEKIAVPLFQETQTAITDFLGRISLVTIDRTRANTAYTSYLCREKGEYPIRKAIEP